MMSSTEDLNRQSSKSKSKHQRKLCKLVKNTKYAKSKKKYLKVGNFTRQVSARRISTISEDCEVTDELNQNTVINKTEAQTPSEFRAKQSMMLNRQVEGADGLLKHKSKAKLSVGKSGILNTKQIEFGKVISGPGEASNDAHIRKPDFVNCVIPKHIKRETSNERDLLSKYIKNERLENHLGHNKNIKSEAVLKYIPTTKNHTIHINELMNSIEKSKRIGSKERSISKTKSSHPLTKGSSKLKNHKRVKSENFISSQGYKFSLPKQQLSIERDKDLMQDSKNLFKPGNMTSQSSYKTFKLLDNKMMNKKSNLYLMKKSKKKDFKSLSNNESLQKYMVLKTKKNFNTVADSKKGKSANVTPKKNKLAYQYTIQSSPTNDATKHNITMNVSIDLTQSHKQKIIFIDKSCENSIPASKHQSIRSTHAK